ncbi:hypothetical protein ACX1C1_20310 [Paenibacillus sp. strain BS8-2]
MRQKSESPVNNELSWLQVRYEQRKNRSVELGINAIDKLVKDNNPVSYRTVSELTRELDPDGEGIHPNTIRKNSELHDYFVRHRTAKPYKPRKRAVKQLLDEMDSFKQIKINRDLERVRQRYMQSTKAELVEHLIRLELYVAQQNQIWLKNEFEKFQ